MMVEIGTVTTVASGQEASDIGRRRDSSNISCTTTSVGRNSKQVMAETATAATVATEKQELLHAAVVAA